MFVLPVSGDKISTKDDGTILIVSSYTSLKNDPAVYIKQSGTSDYMYFSDINTINGVNVEYDQTSKVFNAIGPLSRKYNIPQPKDSIKIKLKEVSYDNELEELIVTGMRLHSTKYGPNQGLVILTKEGEFSIGDLLDVIHKDFSEVFNQQRFKKYYFDYLPLKMKNKQ